MSQEEARVHHTRGLIATMFTIIGIVLFCLFAWRIVHYLQLIRSGEMDLTDLNFDQTTSTVAKLSAQPVSAAQTDVLTPDDPSLGNANAPLHIVEFADFGCPYSREASLVMRSLAREHPDLFFYELRDFPIVELHPLAQKAAEAAACANEQGKFWEYHDKLFQHQTDLDVTSFERFAQAINLDGEKFHACLSRGTYGEEVARDYDDGLKAGVRGTPTFFLNGNRVAGSIPQSILEKVIVSFTHSSSP